MNNQIKTLGKNIAFVLKNENVEDAVKIAIEDIIDSAYSESSDVFIFLPGTIENAFPLIIKGLNPEYGRAIVHSFEAIIKSLGPHVESIDFDEKGIVDFAKVKNKPIAVLLSELIHNPDLPPEIADAIKDGIEDLFNRKIDQSEITEFINSPKYIEMVLRGYAKRNDE